MNASPPCRRVHREQHSITHQQTAEIEMLILGAQCGSLTRHKPACVHQTIMQSEGSA